jgi:fatty-acyl-CoA synthase
MIRSGGENIYPAEVEAVISDHPDVAAVALVAVPDARFLEVGCAVVKPSDPNVDQNELEERLRTFATERLARYKCPRYYAIVEEIPLNAAGKVEKKRLRERYAALGNTPEEAIR